MSTVAARRTCLTSGYKNRDVINITKEGLGSAYESKLQIFVRRHLREDEEIRYILDAAGYLDIRGLVREHPTDNWIRMHVTPGDLLLVPTGIYHRFGLDELNRIRTMRHSRRNRNGYLPAAVQRMPAQAELIISAFDSGRVCCCIKTSSERGLSAKADGTWKVQGHHLVSSARASSVSRSTESVPVVLHEARGSRLV